MPKVKTWMANDGRLCFWCPGCREVHGISIGRPWSWNGNRERPTLSPSVLIRSGHYAPGAKCPPCWCTYNAEHPEDPAPFVCGVCHFFLVDGRLRYLPDCSHSYAGKVVDLEEYDHQ